MPTTFGSGFGVCSVFYMWEHRGTSVPRLLTDLSVSRQHSLLELVTGLVKKLPGLVNRREMWGVL